jgi:hypothetical protein
LGTDVLVAVKGVLDFSSFEFSFGIPGFPRESVNLTQQLNGQLDGQFNPALQWQEPVPSAHDSNASGDSDTSDTSSSEDEDGDAVNSVHGTQPTFLIVQPMLSLISEAGGDKDTVISADNRQDKESPLSSVEPLPSAVGKPPLHEQIEAKVTASKFNPEYQVQLLNLLCKWKHLMAQEMTDIPGTNVVECSIDTGDHKPLFQRPYRVSPQENKVIYEELQKMLQAGVIEPARSPWASPVILIQKSDGSWRFCIDFRKINKITKSIHWPVTRIDDCLACFGGRKWFSNLDLFAGYWQIKMAEQDKEKTTFICKYGTYQFKVMAFGLKNAPSLFQEMMEKVLADVLMQFVVVYLDDVTIHSSDEAEHLKHIDAVFERLDRANLRIKLSKCHFGLQELKFLGFIVIGDGVKVDPKKVTQITNAKAPSSVTEVRQFLGMCSYLRQFVNKFSDVVRPIQKLVTVKRWTATTWTPKAQHAFEEIKQIFTSTPVLVHPEENGQYRLSTDASDEALGAFLELHKGDTWHPVAYLSRTLNSAEKNYSVHEREGLAIVWALKKLRHILLGLSFELYTDNQALVYILSQPNPTGRIARWIATLLEYNYTLRHRKGKDNAVADYLSCPTLVVRPTEEKYPFEQFLKDVTTYLQTGFNPPGVAVSGKEFRRRANSYVLIDHKLYIKKPSGKKQYTLQGCWLVKIEYKHWSFYTMPWVIQDSQRYGG